MGRGDGVGLSKQIRKTHVDEIYLYLEEARCVAFTFFGNFLAPRL